MNIRSALVIFLFAPALLSCRERTTAVSITGYNHMTRLFIGEFYINGAMGPNVSPGTGGGETCCVSLPNDWYPGMKAKIYWNYDVLQQDTGSVPPPQQAEIEIPRYNSPEKVQVHFYENHKLKIVVSPYSPPHPFYPMSKEDLLPWKAHGNKASMREAAARGGGSIDC